MTDGKSQKFNKLITKFIGDITLNYSEYQKELDLSSCKRITCYEMQLELLIDSLTAYKEACTEIRINQ